jgi:hypothetical protein
MEGVHQRRKPLAIAVSSVCRHWLRSVLATAGGEVALSPRPPSQMAPACDAGCVVDLRSRGPMVLPGRSSRPEVDVLVRTGLTSRWKMGAAFRLRASRGGSTRRPRWAARSSARPAVGPSGQSSPLPLTDRGLADAETLRQLSLRHAGLSARISDRYRQRPFRRAGLQARWTRRCRRLGTLDMLRQLVEAFRRKGSNDSHQRRRRQAVAKPARELLRRHPTDSSHEAIILSGHRPMPARRITRHRRPPDRTVVHQRVAPCHGARPAGGAVRRSSRTQRREVRRGPWSPAQ